MSQKGENEEPRVVGTLRREWKNYGTDKRRNDLMICPFNSVSPIVGKYGWFQRI